MREENRAVERSRIAVVEGDSLLRESMALFLRERGCRVETFGSAEEACTAGIFRRFDAVISDFLLPGENGISLLRRVREESKAALTILVTLYRENELPEEARSAGIDCILAKPFRTEELEERLRRLHGRKNDEGEIVGGATA